MKPNVTEYDATTGETVVREMTDDEIAANGWTETATDEAPASDDVGALSTDAG